MSALSSDLMWVVPTSIFLSGIMGSPHCLVMCGPIVLNFAKRKSALVFYQMGRMISYSLAGAVFGAFGDAVLGDQRPAWLSHFSLLIIGFLLVLTGYRTYSKKSLHLPVPKFLNQASNAVWKSVRWKQFSPNTSAGLAGFLTALLPCGHLYSFFIGSMTTGSALKGAVFMFAFWLGSAPLLSLSGLLFGKLLRPNLMGGARWAGGLLVVAGLFSVVSFAAKSEELRKQLQKDKSPTVLEQPLFCH